MIYEKISRIQKLLKGIQRQPSLLAQLMQLGDPALMDKRITKIMEEVSDDLGYSSLFMPSGAGHDAQNMAIIAPTAMIFTPSKDGISHNPKNIQDFDMIKRATDVLLNTILKIDKIKLGLK